MAAYSEVEVKIHNFHPHRSMELSDQPYVPISLSPDTDAMEFIKFEGLSAAKLVRT
jgi:hypothetical protein